jgi:AraC-like DNA-binding protein
MYIPAVTSNLPLSRYQLFHTRDVEEARECVGRIFCPHGLSTTKKGKKLNARHHSAQLHHGVSLNYVQYGPEVDIKPDYLEDFYLLQIPLRGGASVCCGNQHVLANECMASLPSPTEHLSMRWGDNSPHLIVRISWTALQREMEQLTQTPLNEPLVFNLGVPLNSPELSPMLNFVKYLCATLDEDATLSGTSLAAQAESYLLSSLLMLVPHNRTQMLQVAGRRSLMPRSVRRAQDFLHSHVTEQLSLADVCQYLGVSARALQLAFKQNIGQSPMAYLRDIRLDHVRNELLRMDPLTAKTVSQIAAEHGFFHLGHFAAHYQKRFRELPTQTLKASNQNA